jgi:hypothetical protein
VADYGNGVVVPVGAVQAFIGFRDDESSFQRDCLARGKCCVTGQTCVNNDLYFDNEGQRPPPSGRSTNGCQFTFTHSRRVCTPSAP